VPLCIALSLSELLVRVRISWFSEQLVPSKRDAVLTKRRTPNAERQTHQSSRDWQLLENILHHRISIRPFNFEFGA
jgi:hypothetical protein